MSGTDTTPQGALARIRALSIPDDAVSSPEVREMQSLVTLGQLDADEGDSLLVKARDQLEAALAREDLPARDIVAISAELRSLQEKLLAVVERRERRLHAARTKAKVAKVTQE